MMSRMKGVVQSFLARCAGRWMLTLATLLTALGPVSSHATIVEYTVSSLGGNAWRYDYTLTSINLSAPFDELTVFFDFSQYELLSDPLAPAGWDPIFVQPDTGIPSNGLYDALRLAGPLTDTSPISGFSVSFLYLGTETPGSQPFTLLDSSEFVEVQSGQTQVRGTVIGVPEPSTAWLLFLAGSFLTMGRRRRPAHLST